MGVLLKKFEVRVQFFETDHVVRQCSSKEGNCQEKGFSAEH